MAGVNFYLKKAEASGKSLIYLQYFINGKKLTFSFGQSIELKNWDKKKQRVKSNKITTADGKHSLNDMLDNLERICNKTYNEELKNGIPQVQTIKTALENFVNQKDTTGKPTLYELVDRFIANEIKYKGKNKEDNTIKAYKSTLVHLKEFEAIKKYRIDFDTITLSFYYDFISYLENRATKYKAKIAAVRAGEKKKRPIVDLKANTIGKYISKIILFMGEANELGYTTNKEYLSKKFAVPKEETDAIYLSEKDIEKLYRFNYGNNLRLDRVRDLFVFGCFVGLRYQDYSSIKPSNIVSIDNGNGGTDYMLKVLTEKTGELVYIPCHPFVLEIFEKYGNNANKLPASISNQNFNEYIKDACKEAGLNDKGRLLDEPEKEAWECVSSHTARRSFATNYYLDGFPTIDLMKITGHRTEKAFLTYIKVSKLDTAKRLSEHMKRRWEEKKQKAVLRVA